MKYALVLTLVFASILAAADISGKWKGTAETPVGTVERTFVFKVDGSKLTGETTSDRFGKSTIEDGKIDGDNVTFTVTISLDGNEMKASYKGKVSGDTIKFTVEIPGVDQTIEYTAKRVS
jgi:hypothetical protein